jgi:hypothetical protein
VGALLPWSFRYFVIPALLRYFISFSLGVQCCENKLEWCHCTGHFMHVVRDVKVPLVVFFSPVLAFFLLSQKLKAV